MLWVFWGVYFGRINSFMKVSEDQRDITENVTNLTGPTEGQPEGHGCVSDGVH